VLVTLTGASGFIGSYTARALHARGYRVRALVRPTSRRDHIADVVSEWVTGDQADPAVIDHLVDGVDCVIHNSVNWDARAAAEDALQSNLVGTLRLLERARSAGVKQFIFVSSVAALHEISDEWHGRITETHPTWPGGLYGAYKAAVEAYLKAYFHSHGMNTSAWRPAAVYGIDPNLRRSQWYDLIAAVRQGATIDDARGGKITHVQDVADALALAVGNDSTAGQFYALVDGYIYRQRVAEMARELTGSGARILDRTGAGPKNQFDCSKAIALFGAGGNRIALRRGEPGVRAYVSDLIKVMADSSVAPPG